MKSNMIKLMVAMVAAAVLLFACQSATSSNNHTASWQSVGNPAISEGDVKYLAMVLDSSGNPYLAYSDDGDTASGGLNVIHYTGNAWVHVGAANFSPGAVDEVSLAVDSSGTPYVAFEDDTSSNRRYSMKYNGTSWVHIADPATTGSNPDTEGLAADKNGNVYWAVEDDGGLGNALFKFNGTNWTFVAAYTGGAPYGATGSFELTLDGNGVPYFAIQDTNTLQLTVAKLSGSAFVTVDNSDGDQWATAGEAYWPRLAFDSSNTPYLSYANGEEHTNKLNVLKYQGGNWIQVGNPDFSPHDRVGAPNIAVSGTTPYVVYSDVTGTNTGTLTVEKLSGSTWVAVSTTGKSEDSDWHDIAFNTAGVPFVSFLDSANDYKPGVIKYQ